MLILFAVLAIVSAAFLLFRYARRRSLLVSNTSLTALEPPIGARPLFEPTAAEIARAAAHDQARVIARREYQASAELNALIDAALHKWRASRSAHDAAELLAVTATSPRDGDFLRAAREIITVFRESGIAGLAANDLAALLDSHCRLLPTAARSPGALFWLKQEVAELRSESQ